MALDKRHRNSIYSIILFIVLCLIALVINWDSDFAGTGLILMTDAVGPAIVLLTLAQLYIGLFILHDIFKRQRISDPPL